MVVPTQGLTRIYDYDELMDQRIQVVSTIRYAYQVPSHALEFLDRHSG